MNNLYLIGIVVFCFVIIIKSFYTSNKRNKINHKLIQPEIAKKNKWLYPIDEFEKNANQKLIKPEIYMQNKWLYPTDEYGKMEKGTVYESKTYEREIIENNIKYKIINTN